MSSTSAGVGLWVRITHRFGPRQMEWFMAAITAAWGFVLILPAETFSGPQWIIFGALWPEGAWGGLFLALGLARIAGLIVNGSRKQVTPWIRVVAAFCGLLIWAGITAGFALTGVISTWLAIYPAFAVAELVNIYRAAHDAGEAHGPA